MSYRAAYIQFPVFPQWKFNLWIVCTGPDLSVVCHRHQRPHGAVPFDGHGNVLVFSLHHDAEHGGAGHQPAQGRSTDRRRSVNIRAALHRLRRFTQHHTNLSVTQVDLQHFILIRHCFIPSHHLFYFTGFVAAICQRWSFSWAAFSVASE